ncbi:FHA domain-containing protein FhaB [Candidatus Thermoflexus japonica]|uniref:FHA domain-containing protein FhaB n=1 Tax=Candidatus Thermoflexus japonica TaxID=2035417 RepID=A0A2H5Y911_9CHLR|nr:FHA domain-containing protein FhaB [Candidatus Thermoflexus japonica]
MIECPLCGRKYPVGALFCPECGVYLLTGGPLRTEPLPEGVSIPVELPAGSPSTAGARPQSLVLQVLSSGRRVVIRPDQEVLVGRLDVGRGIFPHVDLTPDGGLEGGVSRRHARIFFQNDQFYIEDLGSTNGTYLNGVRLDPYSPRPLGDGDELRLGQISIRVEFMQ